MNKKQNYEKCEQLRYLKMGYFLVKYEFLQ